MQIVYRFGIKGVDFDHPEFYQNQFWGSGFALGRMQLPVGVVCVQTQLLPR